MSAHLPAPPATSARTAPRRRPRDRREQILQSAARAFSANGFHAVRLDDIAADVGISAPALYRHFPNKYALFAETTRTLADALSDATNAVPADTAHPATELRGLLAALTDAAIENRRSGSLYHWEDAFLKPDDARYVRDIVVAQHRRIRADLQGMRPTLDRDEADLIAAAMTSVVASPATHRTALPTRQISELITHAALSLATVELPPEGRAPHTAPLTGLAPTSKRELLLAESIRLFAAHGFHDVTIDDIARAADLPASGVYRHFESKAAILQAAFWRASDRVTAMIADALSSSATPREVVVGLVTRYVDLYLNNNDLISVYVSEIGSVAPRQRTALRNQQRINIEEWAAWVCRDRPDLSAARSRFLVQAVLNVAIDLTRLPRKPSADHICALCIRLLTGTDGTSGEGRSDGVEVGE